MPFRSSKILLILLIAALAFSFNQLQAQTVVNWTDPIAVAPSGLGTGSPRLIVDPEGQPIVLWGKGGSTPTIRMAKWSNGTFSAPTIVSTNGIQPGIYSFGGLDIAINGDTIFVVFEKYKDGIYLLRSTDGGQNFAPPVTVFSPPAGNIVTLATVVTDASGNPLVSYLYEAENETNAIYHLARSTDGGLSFQTPVEASAPADGEYVCECCPSDIVTKGDSVWLAFRSLRPGSIRDIWLSRSIDQGAVFDIAADVDDTDWVLNVCPASAPRTLLAGDSLVTVWMSQGTGTTRVHASTIGTNTDKAGPSFTFPFSGATGTQNRPDIAGNIDTIGIVWEETGIPGNATEVMFAFSTQGTAALPLQISNLTNAPGTQKVPVLAYHQGSFHLLYSDLQTGRLWYRKGNITAASTTKAIDQKPELSVFPNPVSTSFQINWKATAYASLDFRLVNTHGQICQEWLNVLPGQQLYLKGATPGIYNLQTTNINQAISHKMIIRVP